MAGTGKSHLIETFCKTFLNGNYQLIVHKRDLTESYYKKIFVNCIGTNNKFVRTVASFMINTYTSLQLPNLYEKYIRWSKSVADLKMNDEGDLATSFAIVFDIVKSMKVPQFSILILDEYASNNFWLIVVLVVYCYINECHMLFVGDWDQLSVDVSNEFRRLEYIIALAAGLQHINLEHQMRIKDKAYLSKIVAIKNIAKERYNLNTAFIIYKLLKSKHLCERELEVSYDKDVNAIYMAYNHRALKNYVMALSQSAKDDVDLFRVSYLRLCRRDYIPITMKSNRNHKFLHIQMFFVNRAYTCVDNQLWYPVSVTRNEIGGPDKLTVTARNINGTIRTFGYQDITRYILDDMRKELNICVIDDDKVDLNVIEEDHKSNAKLVFGIPLFPTFVSTFHAVQGRTLPPDCKLIIDLSNMHMFKMECRPVYVALTRVASESQVACILKYSNEMFTLMANEIMELYTGDRYFYNIGFRLYVLLSEKATTKNRERLVNILQSVEECDNIESFQDVRQVDATKILRSFFSAKTSTGQAVQHRIGMFQTISQFIADNRDTIRTTVVTKQNLAEHFLNYNKEKTAEPRVSAPKKMKT